MQWSKEKQKEEGEREKQALHCDKEYAAVIEFDLRKLKKNFAQPEPFSRQHYPFCRSQSQDFIAVTMARLALDLH